MVDIKIHKSVFYFFLVLALLGVFVIASKVYVDYNMMGNSITNATWVNGTSASLTNLYATNLESNLDGTGFKVTAANVSGNLTWTDLYNYPTACPADSAITALGDATTCTAYNTGLTWVNSTNMNVSKTLYAGSLSFDTVLTDAQISDTLTCSDLVCTNCIGGTEIAELADADVSNTLTASDLVAGSSVVADAEVDDTLTIVSSTWVNATSSKLGLVYYDTTAVRPAAAEGRCYWNTTATYKCYQCYNSTNWICYGSPNGLNKVD